ncbi:MAG: PD-(D/E)XK nuclease domain-containing protein [Methanobrevibacter sp.]|jgi:Holliday junction resolvase-like predicted endonuclease|nr:PD-(D/E)XK nuclease domain-containing protein [Candidatus Methanovirga aequatorialis]
MIEQLKNMDNLGFNDNLNELLSEIPNILHQSANEYYYHSIFIKWLAALGFKVDSEVSTNIGRIDSVLETEEFIAICEIKHDEKKSHDTLLKEAMNQIKEKNTTQSILKRTKRLFY